jgi:tetratricopeptide (TPR) repeat protein
MAKKTKQAVETIKKVNTDTALIVIGRSFEDSKIKTLAQTVNQNSSLKEVFVYSDDEQFPKFSSGITGAIVHQLEDTLNGKGLDQLKNSNCNNFIFVSGEYTGDLNYAIGQSKKSIEGNTLYFCGNRPQDEKAKKNIGGLARIWYEAKVQMGTSVSASGSHSGIALLDKDALLKITQYSSLDNFASFDRFALRAGYKEIPMSNIGQFKDLKVEKPIKKVWSNFTHSLTERWKYFIADPLHQLKTKEWRSSGANHPLYRSAFFILTILAFVIYPILSSNYNSTWDENLHQMWGNDVLEYFTQGDNTINEDQSQARGDKKMYYTMKYYGASFDVITAAIHKIMPGKDIYSIRHFVNALMGVFSFLFCGLLAKEFGGWRAAVFGFLLIAFSPSYMGHIMNNPKDIPFAMGFAMGLLYLIRLYKQLPSPNLATKLYLMLAIAFAISVRPPGIILIAFLAFFMFVHWLVLLDKKQRKSEFMKYAKIFLGIGIVGYLLGIILWPYGLEDPVNNPFSALQELSQFSLLTFYELFEGVRVYQRPWNYIPQFIAITAPIIVLIGLAASLLGFKWEKEKGKRVALFLVFFALVFPIVYAIYKDSYVYNGWRHFLFSYVPIASLAGIGFSLLLNKMNKIGSYVTYGLLVIGIGKVAFWQIQNHPYEYIYFNEMAGGVKGAVGDYETDYWCQTPKAALEWLMKNEVTPDKKVVVMTNNKVETLKSVIARTKFKDSLKIDWAREYEWHKLKWDYAIWTTRTLSKNQIEGKYWPPKGTIKTIDVDGVPIAAIVKRENTSLWQGLQFLKSSKFQDAIAPLKDAVAYDPYEEEAARALGMAYKNMGNGEEALKYLKKAVELRNGNYNAYEAIAEIKMFQGEMEKQKGNRELSTKLMNEAKGYFQEAINHKTNFSTAYYYLGNIYLNEGYYRQAIENLTKVIERNPELTQAYFGIARAQIELSQYDEAIENLNIAIQLNPNFREAYGLMAEAYKRAGNPQAAQQVLSKMPK